jgi:hypothetical protein
MDKDKALATCEKYLVVWTRYKKDSTAKENSPNMWSELNIVHRFVYGHFEDMGCNDCIARMFRQVFAWYERETNKPVEPTKNVQMTFPETTKETAETPQATNLDDLTFKEIMNKAKSIPNIKLPRNAVKQQLIDIIKTNS